MAEYGRAHRRARAALKPDVDAGRAYGAELVCLEPDRWIQPGTDWDLAHDRETGGYLGPAHTGCNRAEGARFALGKTHPDMTRWVL